MAIELIPLHYSLAEWGGRGPSLSRLIPNSKTCILFAPPCMIKFTISAICNKYTCIIRYIFQLTFINSCNKYSGIISYIVQFTIITSSDMYTGTKTYILQLTIIISCNKYSSIIIYMVHFTISVS
jgi:hypothetical protein